MTKLTIHIQIKYSVLLPSRVAGHTGVLAAVGGLSFVQSQRAAVWTEAEGSNRFTQVAVIISPLG